MAEWIFVTAQLYRMHDASPAGVFPVEDKEEAREWNTPERGFGIFLTVNEFDGPRRKEHLARINAWAVDMDVGSKAEQHDRLLRAPLVPTLIVETKRGYQAWWGAQDGQPQHWNAIVLERLVPFFGADKNARDLCRILRMPGFLHLKDPADPFRVRVAWRHDVTYSERQLARAFRWVPDQATQRATHDEQRRAAESEIREQQKANAIAAGLVPTESLWDAIYALDCEEGLRRLSGHWSVSGERYDLRRTGRGNLNIFVDKGKGWTSSPCWVDAEKRIGSPTGGGPTLAQWLRWFRHDWPAVIKILKEVFPQLDEIDRAARDAERAQKRAS